jgi:hypothetical protein
MPLPNPLYELSQSLIHPAEYHWLFAQRPSYFFGYLRWQHDARYGPRVAIAGPEKATVILLNYRRVRNLEPMVRSLLLCDFVEKVLVSNNNPEYRIADWIRLKDERIHLVDQPRRTVSSIRFRIACEEPGPYFLAIDDDVFLYPHQVKRLFEELLARPSSPHGIQGENFHGETTPNTFLGWQVNIHRYDGQADDINTCYAFTREHALEADRLARCLGLDLANIPMGSDVILSASGRERPFLHDVGKVLHCLSQHRLGVATWTLQGFFPRRAKMFRSLRALKGWPAPPLPVEMERQQGAA